MIQTTICICVVTTVRCLLALRVRWVEHDAATHQSDLLPLEVCNYGVCFGAAVVVPVRVVSFGVRHSSTTDRAKNGHAFASTCERSQLPKGVHTSECLARRASGAWGRLTMPRKLPSIIHESTQLSCLPRHTWLVVKTRRVLHYSIRVASWRLAAERALLIDGLTQTYYIICYKDGGLFDGQWRRQQTRESANGQTGKRAA